MNRDEVFSKVADICKDVFDNENLVLTEDSSAKNVDCWDSLTHLSVISDIEDEFGISLTLDELNSSNLGELVDAVMKHLS